MKKYAVLTILFLTSLSAEAIPDTYPLICRGGGDFEVFALNASNTISAVYTFTRSNRAAPLGIDVGSCAWIDRGVSNAEPTALHFNVNSVLRKNVSLQFSVSGGKLGRISMWDYSSSGGTTQIFQMMRDPSAHFTVFAYNTGSLLEVDRLGP